MDLATLIKPVLTSERPAKIGHHLKFAAHVLKRAGTGTFSS